MSESAKPCPRCASQRVTATGGRHAGCVKCGVCGMAVWSWISRRAAVKRWNAAPREEPQHDRP